MEKTTERKTNSKTKNFINTLIKYLDGGVDLVEMGPKIMVIYASEGLHKMIGADREHLKLPCELKKLGIHPDYEADYEQTLRDGLAGGKTADHIHRISSDGKHWVWRHARAARIDYPEDKYPVMLVLSTDISEMIRTEASLRESNERLRAAFRQTPYMLWEVETEKRIFSVFDVEKLCCREETMLEDFPQSFLDRELIHPDSAEDFLEFAEQILGGSPAGSGNFVMKDHASGSYGWVAMSYRMTYDEDGRPRKAVGVQSKLPDVSGIGGGFMHRRPLPEAMRRDILMRMKVNLTKDAVEDLWFEGTDQTAWTWGRTYSQIIEMEKKRFFIWSDCERFGERFSRENLLELYSRNGLWTTEEYRRVDHGGNIGWMRDFVNLAKDPKNGDIYMYSCCIGSDAAHEREAACREEIQRDPASGLYTMESVKRIAAAIPRRQGEVCALALIRTEGRKPDENLWRYISIAVMMALGMDCVTGQYRPGILLAYLPDAGSRFDVKRRIEDVFAYIRIAMEDITELGEMRFLAGVVAAGSHEADYDTLLLRAGYLSDQNRDTAVDTVFFPSEDEDWAWTSLRREIKEEETVTGAEPDRPLTKEEQAYAFHCVTAMLSACSLETSLLDALRNLGRFYDASRVYILKIKPDRQTLDMASEWVAGGKKSIRHVVQDVRIRKIPLLQNCLRERKPVKMHTPVADISGGGKRTWNYIAYPLKEDGNITGFLCVENAVRNAEDTAMLETLEPYITGEEKRFRTLAEHGLSDGQDTLTRLPNLSSYMDVIYSMDSDSYSAMGVLALDVPNYSAINSSYGFEYGKKMLVFIADTLQGVYGKSHIFRTWDAEFVVLFPNTIREVFNGRCTRLRTMLQRRYPRQIRIGTVWSDGVFSARHLVKEAQAIMRRESVSGPAGKAAGEEAEETSGEEKIQKTFVPYYQPKIDMRSGTVAGAEALARRIDDDGAIHAPGQFIEDMEENGSIRELDLFMLETVLRQLSEWKEQGFPAIKVSVNISRVTLMNPSALASVLALQSRYPEIRPDQIRLEITETAGEMETATLAEIIDKFGECGIGFELDDFGSGWSNISMFSNIRFATVKLDRSLTNDLPDNEISSMMVENITQICRDNDINCIAEGVETREQAEALMRAGCVYGQGFYFAKPLPAREFAKRYLM